MTILFTYILSQYKILLCVLAVNWALKTGSKDQQLSQAEYPQRGSSGISRQAPP